MGTDVCLTMDGDSYATHKDAFKAILKRHGLLWKGTRDNVWWGSAAEKVEATYVRDEAADVTISATLCWKPLKGQGSSPCLEELRTWAAEVGIAEGGLPTAAAEAKEAAVSKDQMIWDLVWRPQEGALEAKGRPKSWIEQDRRRFEEERAKRQGSDPALSGGPQRRAKGTKGAKG